MSSNYLLQPDNKKTHSLKKLTAAVALGCCALYLVASPS
jgi:hypothetical protein